MSGQPTNADQTFSRVVRLLGDDFVRYVLSIPEDTPVESIQLSQAQEQAVQVIATQTMARGSSDSIALDTYMQTMNLSTLIPGANTSIVNALRQSTGGQIEEADSPGDDFVDSLIAIARDIWPVYLVRPQGEGPRTFWMSTPSGAYGHPALTKAVDAFLADDKLKKLFPYPPNHDSPSGDDGWAKGIGYQSIIITNGRGGSLQLISLVPGLLANAVFRCLIGGEKLGLKALVPHVIRATEDLRSLADGRTVNVPALLGLAGVRVPEGTTLDLPEGRLRSANAADRELFLAGTNSLVTVFETTFPIKVYSIQEHKFEEGEDPFKEYAKYQTRISEANRSFAHMLDLVRLSLFLASSSEEPWLAREVARYIPDSLTHGGTSSWDPGFANVSTYDLPEEKFDAVRMWHTLVKNKHVPSLDIGMRRLLSASTMRTDPIDAFVDAVICWETLFGVQTETTFRVTGSIAKLLEPSSLTRREALHRELKDIYSKRSRLVHGGSEPRPEEVAENRQRAIEIAADCFRTLYRDRADLLELASDARGARLLLE